VWRNLLEEALGVSLDRLLDDEEWTVISLLALYGYKWQGHSCTISLYDVTFLPKTTGHFNKFFLSIMLLFMYCSNVSPSDSNVTLPRWISTDYHQMSGDVTRLNTGVPQTNTRWQETPVHRIQSHWSADDIQRTQVVYARYTSNWGFHGNYVKDRHALHIIGVSTLTTGTTMKV
jgi:hypothetical protein